MPSHVIFNAVITLDGKESRGDKPIEFISRMDRYRIHQLRGKADAIMVDVDVIKERNPELSVRKEVEEPCRVIIDAGAETPPDANILKSSSKVIIAISKQAPKSSVNQLEKLENVETMVSGNYAVNLSGLLRKLYKSKSIETIFLERGGSLPKRMLDEHLIDEIYVSIIPSIIGKTGSFTGLFDIQLKKEMELSLEGILQYGDQVVLHYTIR